MKTNSHMSALIGVGADAMRNMYEVHFTLPSALNIQLDQEDFTNLTVRATGFTPPAETHTHYKVHWKTVSWDKPSAKIDMERTFEITFRLDQNYRAYEILKAWKGLTSTASKSYASNDLRGSTGEVAVKALAGYVNTDGPSGTSVGPFSEQENQIKWEYEDVWISSITNPAYAPEVIDPASITVTFRFGDFKDPFY